MESWSKPAVLHLDPSAYGAHGNCEIAVELVSDASPQTFATHVQGVRPVYSPIARLATWEPLRACNTASARLATDCPRAHEAAAVPQQMLETGLGRRVEHGTVDALEPEPLGLANLDVLLEAHHLQLSIAHERLP